MGISIPLVLGTGLVLGMFPFLKKGIKFTPPSKKPDEPKKESSKLPVYINPSPVVDVVADTVITHNKIKLVVVGALVALAMAVVKVNEK